MNICNQVYRQYKLKIHIMQQLSSLILFQFLMWPGRHNQAMITANVKCKVTELMRDYYTPAMDNVTLKTYKNQGLKMTFI